MPTRLFTLAAMSARRLISAAVVAGLCAVAAGCGSSNSKLAAQTTPAGNPLQAPQVTDVALRTGSDQHRITETIVAFYRAAWTDNASEACGLFSTSGAKGFMHAAAVSFPQSINKYSNCEHAMQIYNATLADSAETTQENDTAFNPSALNKVGVAAIQQHGSSATAIAPTNVADLINPKQIELVRTGDHWMISGSKSLNGSNLQKILSQAKAQGLLKRTK